MSDLRIGMIGLDTSHVTAFAGLLNDPQNPHHVPGAKVTVAFPGGSPDFEASMDVARRIHREQVKKQSAMVLNIFGVAENRSRSTISRERCGKFWIVDQGLADCCIGLQRLGADEQRQHRVNSIARLATHLHGDLEAA